MFLTTESLSYNFGRNKLLRQFFLQYKLCCEGQDERNLQQEQHKADQNYFVSADTVQAVILQVWSNQEGKKKNTNCGILPLHVM